MRFACPPPPPTKQFHMNQKYQQHQHFDQQQHQQSDFAYPPQQQQQQQQSQEFSDLGGGVLSGVGLMSLDSNNVNQPLRPDGQQPSMSGGGGGAGSVGIVGDQSAPGGAGGAGGGAWGPFGSSTSFSPSSAEPSAGGALNGLPGAGRAQQDGEAADFSLAGSGFAADRSPDGGPMFAGLAVSGGGGSLGDLSRSVQPDVAPPPDPGDWKMYTSAENGNRAYWHNAKSGETVSMRRDDTSQIRNILLYPRCC